MHPDEIFAGPRQPKGGGGMPVDPEQAWREIQNLDLNKVNPLALLAIGAVGGALGAQFLKGGVGLVAGGVIGLWAWNTLSK